MLSNLLQELTLAKDSNRKHIVLDETRLNENPVERLSRLIRYSFWPNLTRRIDASSIEKAGRDPKDWTDDPRYGSLQFCLNIPHYINLLY